MTETDKQRLTEIMLRCLGTDIVFKIEGDYIEVSRDWGMDDDFKLTYDYSDNEIIFSNCSSMENLRTKFLQNTK